ncbi:MAG: hypothetical protein ACR2OI_07860 [Acidimicrobiia bacterium]
MSDHWIVRSVLCAALAAAALAMLANLLTSLSVGEPLPDLVTAINNGDDPAVAATLGESSEEWMAMTGWLMATEAELSLNGCRTNLDASTTCQVHFGPAWFFNRAAPPEVAAAGSFATSITGRAIGDQFMIIDWPLPAALRTVDRPFRLWAMQIHPDEAAVMWEPLHLGRGVSTTMRIDKASGQARSDLLDEYLAFRNPPTT